MKPPQLKTVQERFKMRDESKSKLIAFPALWRKGTPIEQKRLLRTIFKYLMPTTNSLQVFFWLNEGQGAPGTPGNEKRDVDSSSSPLAQVLPFPRVLPAVGIPAIVKFGVIDPK